MLKQKLKTIGLIGGMSWRSSLDYYRIINEHVSSVLDRFHSAKIIMYSVDFEEIEQLQHQEKWAEATDIMIDAAKRLERAGADFVLICTNTMHKMADDVEANVSIPLLHIVDVTAEEIKVKKLKKVGLLGTKFTMEQDFYKKSLTKHGIEVIIPQREDREIIHQIIYNELILGKAKVSSVKECIGIIDRLATEGAQGIILGCTELPLLIKSTNINIPLFDTTEIHALAAANLAFSD